MSGHDTSTTYGDSWVSYADSVAAQMEYYWEKKPELRKNNNGVACLEVDIAGRVTSAQDRNKAFASETGTAYRIDLDRMVQINCRTGFERDVLRRIENKNAVVTAKSTGKKTEDEDQLMDEDVPPFPADLIDQKTGSLKEPLLHARCGQLIQVQSRRDDGWACA